MMLRALAVAAVVLPGAAGAATLGSLFAGGTFTSGDKTFGNFVFGSSDDGSIGSPIDMTLIDAITVEAIGGGLNPGIRFNTGAAVQSPGQPSSAELAFSFDVMAPSAKIVGLTLDIDGTFPLGSGNDDVQAVADAGSLGSANSLISDVTVMPSDSTSFLPQQTISVTAVLSAFSSGGTGNTVSLDTYDLTVNQVPLPAGAWLLLAAFGTLGACTRARRA